MKDSPYLPYLYRLTSVRKIGAATVLRLNAKLKAEPGQVGVLSLSGTGELTLPVASYSTGYTDFYVVGDGLTHDFAGLRKGDKVGFRGPYGKPFPLRDIARKDIIFIADNSSFGYARSCCEWLAKETRRRKTRLVMLTDDDIDEAPLAEIHRGISGITQAEHDRVIVNLTVQDISAVLSTLGYKPNQVYGLTKRDIRCGIGKCGHCITAGRYMCKEQPLIRLDAT
jgi:hypothetical protein